MPSKPVSLRIRSQDRYIFEAVKTGRKKIETRAATKKFRGISAGDSVVLVCSSNRIVKKVIGAEIFKTIGAVLKEYRPEAINPKIRTAKEARDMWFGFPGYREKIKKYGLIVLHFK